jgi:lipooligosaccharide transport system ATP-binding protein
VDVVLHPGEILGILGPNGAGKTTIVGMLYGAVLPSGGCVRIGGWELPRQGREARSMMGIVTQDDNLDPDFDVTENLLCFAHHYRLRGSAARERVDALLERVGLIAHRHHRVDELSGGLMRRLVLARALINTPRIVFLDEPTTGLDPESRQDFWKQVAGLRHEGCGVLLTTHYMDEAQRLCDRLILLQQGEKVDEGSPADLIERTVGRGVLEIEGVADEFVSGYATRLQTWWRPFGSGFIVAVPPHVAHVNLEELEREGPTRLSLRRANLEDVFLRLTGARLE